MLDNWDKIKSLFLEVIDLPPEERAAYLDKKCKDDLSLRKEVESLIESDQKVESFLEKPIIQNDELNTESTSPDSFIGMKIGNLL